MSWGWKITALYLGFVLMMSTLVYLCTQQDILLVTDNYYEKDLQYDNHILRRQNTAQLEEDVTISYKPVNHQITIQFPKGFETIDGRILFYRPSKVGLDFSLPIEVNEENIVQIHTERLLEGHWRIKINWEGDGQIFYKETIVNIRPFIS